MRKCMSRLGTLLEAKEECIWINTYEETNVINDIIRLVLSQESSDIANIYTWSIYEGLRELQFTSEGVSSGSAIHGTKNIMNVLKHIGDSQISDDGSENIYILKDLHSCIDNQGILVRGIRDLKERKPDVYNPIIVTSPTTDVPSDLEKIFNLLYYELPDRDDVIKIIDKSIDQLKKDDSFVVPSDEERKELVNSCLGLTQKEIISAFKKSSVSYDTINPTSVTEEKIELVKKSGILDYASPYCSMEDIGGNYELKQWLDEVKDSMSEEAVAFGCQKPKGFLSIGIPGCSKTMFANAIASDWNFPLLKLSMSKIMSRLVGESERKMAQALKIAESCSPCVLLIDEVEKTLGGIQSSNQSDSGTTARTFEQILQFLQEENDVFVIMTSNDIEQLPPELYRSERLEAIWYFSLPTVEERREIYSIHLNSTNKEISEDLIDFCADNSDNFTGAEIAQSVKNGVRKAFSRYKEDGNDTLTKNDMKEAIQEVSPIYKVNRERIHELETWAKGRARYTNESSKSEEYANDSDSKLLTMLDNEFNI